MSDWQYQSTPQPSVNGGWYTGTAFPKDAPWRNFPVNPEVSYLIHRNLRSAAPPPGATEQYPTSFRPGNNAPSMPGVLQYSSSNNIMCTQGHDKYLISLPPPKFARYSYY